jgi:glutathione synthase/RimK-type ligase-like ATP-grasp enzyme
VRQRARPEREMGLAFGAIDMIRDADDSYWFLENNPNGQWAYVEHATGQPIGHAIATMLSARCLQ